MWLGWFVMEEEEEREEKRAECVRCRHRGAVTFEKLPGAGVRSSLLLF